MIEAPCHAIFKCLQASTISSNSVEYTLLKSHEQLTAGLTFTSKKSTGKELFQHWNLQSLTFTCWVHKDNNTLQGNAGS